MDLYEGRRRGWQSLGKSKGAKSSMQRVRTKSKTMLDDDELLLYEQNRENNQEIDENGEVMFKVWDIMH
jgi:hypothetical protein